MIKRIAAKFKQFLSFRIKRWKTLLLIFFASLLTFFFYSNAIQEFLFDFKVPFQKVQSIELKAGEAVQWKPFSSPEKEFQISFPQKPKQEETELPIPQSNEALPYKEFHCTHAEAIRYSLSYTELPSPWLRFSSSLVLKASLKMVAKHISKGKIISKNMNRAHRYPAICYLMQKGDKELKGELILIGNRLYKLEVSYPQKIAPSIQSNAKEFFASFKPLND